MARVGLLSSSMSNLDTVPEKGPIPRLVGIIQKLNADLDRAQRTLLKEQQRLQEEKARCQKLTNDYSHLQFKYLCEDCRLHLRTTPPGDTFCFCETCNEVEKTVVELRGENQRLRRALEDLKLEPLYHNERHDDGTRE